MAELKTMHPLLMVPEVVIYHAGERPVLTAGELRSSIAQQLPPGTGVGPVMVVNHGQFITPRPTFVTADRVRTLHGVLGSSVAEAEGLLRRLEAL